MRLKNIIHMLGLFALVQALFSTGVAADDIWIAPGQNPADRRVGNWAVTSRQQTIFSFGVPEQMSEFVSATVVLIGRRQLDITYDVSLSVSRNLSPENNYTDSRPNLGPVTLVQNELLEIDVSDIINDAQTAIGPLAPGQDYLTLRFAVDSINQGWVIGMRFRFTTNPSVPAGTIVMWSGGIASIPAGWALCDGSNGTPDLRSRFIVGAGSAYGEGDIGGVDAHNHGPGTYLAPGHVHAPGSYTGSSHGHTMPGVDCMGWDATPGGPLTCDHQNAVRGVSFVGAVSQPAGEGAITGTSGEAGNGPLSGSSDDGSNLPPYYALAFIMKI